jgi:hypothetical protein
MGLPGRPGNDRSSMKYSFSFLAAACAFLLTPQPVSAHHGWAAFLSDPETQITLKGTVKEFHFVNPHSVIELLVKDGKGNIQLWEGELTSNTNLAPRGWTAITIEDKQEISVTGFPARNGSHALRVTRIVLSNGKELKISGAD